MRKLLLVLYIIGNLVFAFSFMNVVTLHMYSEWRGSMIKMIWRDPQQKTIDTNLVEESMERLNEKLVDKYVFLFFPWIVCLLSSCAAVVVYSRASGSGNGSSG